MCDRCKRMKRENRERRNALRSARAAPETQRHRQDSISLAPTGRARARSARPSVTWPRACPRISNRTPTTPPRCRRPGRTRFDRSLCSPEAGTDAMRRAGGLEAARIERAVAQRAALESQKPTPQDAGEPGEGVL